MIRTKCCKSTDIYVVTGNVRIDLKDVAAIMKLKLDGNLEGKTFHYECGACESACDISDRPHFTREQIDWICYQIGDWYLQMKPLLEGQHNLGYMKERLKLMICGDEESE